MGFPVKAHSDIIDVESEVVIKKLEYFKANKYGFSPFLFHTNAKSFKFSCNFLNKSSLVLLEHIIK